MFQGGLNELVAQMRAKCPKGAENCICADRMESDLSRGNNAYLIIGGIPVPLGFLLELILMQGHFFEDEDDELIFGDSGSYSAAEVLDLELAMNGVFSLKDPADAFVPVDVVDVKTSAKY